MKPPIHPSLSLAVLANIALVTPAFALVNIDYVTVGNANNAADPATGSIYGAVNYEFRIAKNETTVSQYATFLNAVAKTDTYGLYNIRMTFDLQVGSLITQAGESGNYSYTVAPGRGNLPIAYVSWFDAARFSNWLHNGQPTGLQTSATTEDGAYTLNGAISGAGTGVTFTRNVGATVWIPSESEWYKAAYYDPTKNDNTGGYWLHANQSDSMSSNTVGVAGAANHFSDGIYAGSGTSSLPDRNAFTEVGAYGENSESYYGTNDQGGNLWEWSGDASGNRAVLRGGSWVSSVNSLPANSRVSTLPTSEGYSAGFRVATIIPEPSSLLLAIFAGGLMMVRRRRF